MKHYTVIRADGTPVIKGELLFTRDETWKFVSCTHPRKITVEYTDDTEGYPNRTIREFYANVFNVGIYDVSTKEWTFDPPPNLS